MVCELVSGVGRVKREDVRIVEFGHLSETVYHLVGPWPGEIGRVVFWSRVYVGR